MANPICKSQGWRVCVNLAYKAVLQGRAFSSFHYRGQIGKWIRLCIHQCAHRGVITARIPPIPHLSGFSDMKVFIKGEMNAPPHEHL